MPTAQCKEVSIHYELSGNPNGHVVLFSNSLSTTLEMWQPQLGEFERHFHVLRYDMRGHGKSSAPTGPYSIESLGGDVIALLDALAIQKVHFCGLSIGGGIGQWLGIHTPFRLHTLTLCNTAARIGTAETWNVRIATVQKEGMQAVVEGILARWFTPSFLASGSPDLAAMRHMLATADPSGYVATCAAIRDMDLREEMISIECRALIIGGEFDFVTTIADSQFLHESIPGSTLAVLPAAHISNVEVPEKFNGAVLKFLSQDGAA